MSKDIVLLIRRIEEMRERLYQTALIHGLSSCKTINVSQQLDHLLSDYQKSGVKGSRM